MSFLHIVSPNKAQFVDRAAQCHEEWVWVAQTAVEADKARILAPEANRVGCSQPAPDEFGGRTAEFGAALAVVVHELDADEAEVAIPKTEVDADDACIGGHLDGSCSTTSERRP